MSLNKKQILLLVFFSIINFSYIAKASVPKKILGWGLVTTGIGAGSISIYKWYKNSRETSVTDAYKHIKDCDILDKKSHKLTKFNELYFNELKKKKTNKKEVSCKKLREMGLKTKSVKILYNAGIISEKNDELLQCYIASVNKGNYKSNKFFYNTCLNISPIFIFLGGLLLLKRSDN